MYAQQQQKIQGKCTGLGIDDGVDETLESCSFAELSVTNKCKRFDFIMFESHFIKVLCKVGNSDLYYIIFCSTLVLLSQWFWPVTKAAKRSGILRKYGEDMTSFFIFKKKLFYFCLVKSCQKIPRSKVLPEKYALKIVLIHTGPRGKRSFWKSFWFFWVGSNRSMLYIFSS